VAHVEVDPDAVAGTGSQIAAASLATAPTVTVRPAAPDPVSTAVAQSFAARVNGIAGYTAAAGAVTSQRATMLAASGPTTEGKKLPTPLLSPGARHPPLSRRNFALTGCRCYRRRAFPRRR
jgi:hypothetical protein